MRQLPIGISNFRDLINTTDLAGKHYLFVDKSLLIRDILNNLAEVILITRPRRFGKTLNMSMLRHFFAAEVNGQGTAELFTQLKIAQEPICMQYQGKYPVVYVTFKDIKSKTFAEAYANFTEVIAFLYEEHKQILSGESLTDHQKQQYNLLLTRQADLTSVKYALKKLIYYLYKYYKIKPIVLIDEYDTPIQTAYVESYYPEMAGFMREFFGITLKDNTYLQRAILTGILRVAKESLFSGLNNLEVDSMLMPSYGEYFGFTEQEINELLTKVSLTNCQQLSIELKTWYNGYQYGKNIVYNPWSIINCLKQQGVLGAYWLNTSDNALVKKLLLNTTLSIREQLEDLLKNIALDKLINENFVFSNLESNETAIWTLLLMAGYLTVTKVEMTELGQLCKLKVPNKEIKVLYKLLIAEWLSGSNDAALFNQFLTKFLAGEMQDFSEQLQRLFLQTCSVYDVKGKVPEKFYQGFMLGLLATLDPEKYAINSNKESGLGRYDIAILPMDRSKLGIIIELKSIEIKDLISDLALGNKNLLQVEAELALQQIENRDYKVALKQQGIQQFLKVGIAFSGKELAVAYDITK